MKKEEIFEKLAKFTKSLMFLVVLVAFNAILWSFLVWQVIQSTAKKTTEAMNRTVYAEQILHKNKAESIISEMENNLNSLDEDMVLFKKKKILNLDKKTEIFEKIKLLEKNSADIDMEYGEYKNDLSLQFYPGRDKEVDSYFNRARILPLKIGRFTRGVEEMLYSSYPTSDNYELAKRALYDLRWQLAETKSCP